MEAISEGFLDMHEMSLASGIAMAIEESLEGREVKRVRSVNIEVGALAMVNVEQLSYCFSIAAKGVISGAELRVERKEARYRCTSCNREYSSDKLLSSCDHCGSCLELLSGDQLLIKKVDAEVL